MPAELLWNQLPQKGACPKPRSGHSLTHVGGQAGYIMYGGIEAPEKDQKVMPCGDIYTMKLYPKECRWEREKGNGDELPPARAQHVALPTQKGDRIFVYGGHASPTVRLNDTWWLKVSDLTWSRALGDKAVKENEESAIGAPCPRANAGACLFKGKFWIYGGHGGLSYARIAYSDIYSFDIETEVWQKHEPVVGQAPPQPGRGGHSLFAWADKLYSYGGWNSESQFNEIIVFDINTCEWTIPDIYNDVARWNHSAIMVEAIPSWKYFIFGGESTNFNEGQVRTFGEYVNTACFLDISGMRWSPVMPESDSAPAPREYAAISYDYNSSRLVVFGGWSNGWLSDMWSLNVSKIVGPSYAITSIDPPLGQLSGGVPVNIRGVGFKDQNIKIYFTQGKVPTDIPGKNTVETVGTFVSETEVTALTPSFEAFGPKECVVQISVSGGDLTTTWVPFSYFMNTRAYKSLCYGPGFAMEACPNEPVEFVICARNDSGENRKSGRDIFEVNIKDSSKKEVACEIVDLDDGSYRVKYKAEEEGDYTIEVLFLDDKGKMVPVRGSPYVANFAAGCKPEMNTLVGPVLPKYVAKTIEQTQNWMKETQSSANTKDKNLEDIKVLIQIFDAAASVMENQDSMMLQLDQLEETLNLLVGQNMAKESQIKQTKKLFDEFTNLKKLAKDTKKEINPLVAQETSKNNNLITKLEEDLKAYFQEMKKRDFYKYECGKEQAQEKLGHVFAEIAGFEFKISEYGFVANKFGNPNLIDNAIKQVESIKGEVNSMRGLWDHISHCQVIFENNLANTWENTDCDAMDSDTKKLQVTLKGMKVDKRCNAYTGVFEEIKRWLNFIPLITELRDPAMRERHWDAIRAKVQVNFTVDAKLMLGDVYNLNLNKYQEDVEEIADQAKQEAKMEKTLAKLQETWTDVKFIFDIHKGSDVQMFKLKEEDFEMLEENQQQVNAMFSSRYLSTFEEQCNRWQKSLASMAEIVTIAGEVQRTWQFLENLFIHSEEVKKELPKESEKFIGIDKEVKRILADAVVKELALVYCDQEWVYPAFDQVERDLRVCEKALNDFMESKRAAFPRFHFVSPADLLDILSNGNAPAKIMVHMPKIFQAIETLELKEEGVRPCAVGMHTNVGAEFVPWLTPLKLMGKVETYMQDVIDNMRSSLKDGAGVLLRDLSQKSKYDWIKDGVAQAVLLINILTWTRDVEGAFDKLQAGNKNGMQEAHDHQIQLLSDLITMVQGDLTKPVRQKIMAMITMDAHSRDIINLLKIEKVDREDEFQWQSQLKVYWNEEKKDFQLRIADAAFWYGYEYLGNGARLVITPLTDRIYVTATQALHLSMGCAPSGPAGTGKTETTKDLSSALGKAIYVFNCSPEMDYKGMGGIFKGLAASGSWGCFDEFNRLIAPVLSVCTVQFKAVTDAIRMRRGRCVIQDDEISVDPTCGAFITMNPGYLGRAELPEGLKALFRPITVVVPDLELICENMLMSEGFVHAKVLARKFTQLYFLCRDLLSKAAHYDWGLRAIKSVLVVAGSFRRDQPNMDELGILLRALRDFNIPKIVAEDTDIFFGLLGDLFPGIDVPRTRDMRFEGIIQKVVADQGLHNDESFVLKVVQLSELLVIRHCVFTMGPPAAGKSSTWKTLAKAQDADGKKTTVIDVNPKVVSTNELYGIVHMTTREWIDGLMSKTMRSLSQLQDTNPKWIILDGDLDANWIESMNSVMDDNKLLTLASNERIVVKPHMRLIFEIRNLKFATPATVSRAGILYISDADGYQWRAYVKSWISAQQKFDAERKKELQGLFDKYMEESLKHIKKTFKYLVPVVELTMISSVCKLLEAMLVGEIKGLEYIFVFACVWCLGAGFAEKDGHDYRKEFSNWWKDKWKTIKFQSKGTVYDYYVDIENTRLDEWSKLNVKDVDSMIDTTKSISSFTVPTPDTLSSQFLMKKFLNVNHSPLLVGQAGCGKTQIIKGLLFEMTTQTEDYLSQIINFNYYTDSGLLQSQLESLLEKKAGRTFAPFGKYKLIQFIDDLNMPMLDKYDTQSAIALLRQHKDYEHWYDRAKLSLKDIKNTLHVCSMNPTAGSFFVNPRLQRWFWTLAIPFPEQSSLKTIYATFLNKHFSVFKSSIAELVSTVIMAALNLHSEVEKAFRKTAVNFHYEFNVRHLTNVFQGLLVAKPDAIKEPDMFVKLWVHESERIYGDRLVNAENLNQYRGLAADIVKKNFGKFNLSKYFTMPAPEPLIFAYFVGGLDDKIYDQFPKIDDLAFRLREALREYNDCNATMDLVLFEDAMKHVCKITRIISADSGHALLVGVGGSGKQSLTRLSAFITSSATTSIMISSTYGMNELKADLQKMFLKSGTKDEGICFLFTEGQITNEKFLVYINDLLSSGEISDLFQAEDIDGIVNAVRPGVKNEGLVDSKDNCWKFFIDRVKKNLHMSLCFSPVGDAFRTRARKFPAIINATVIDWFHPWPEDALLSVAGKFLEELEMPEEIRESVVKFMPHSFKIVNNMSDEVKQKEGRFIYTTPKSFLELIKLFKNMLNKQMTNLVDAKERYELGIVKIIDTQEIVSKLEEDLLISSVEVEAIKKEADAQATIVGAEKEKVDAQAATANIESAKCAVIKDNVEKKMAHVKSELDKALPLVEKAKAALDGLNLKDLQNLKALNNPPAAVAMTFTCVLHLLCNIDKNIPQKKGKLDAPDPWKACLKLMQNPGALLESLKGFGALVDSEDVPPQNFKAIQPVINDESFNVENISGKSSAAGGICDWVINIDMYYKVVVQVEPLKLSVAEAQEQLAAANAKKDEMETLVADLTEKLNKLMTEFKVAMDAKEAAESEAARCASRLDLANRLVTALGSESERWNAAIVQLGLDIDLVVGDVLLAAAFVSYVGPFNKTVREKIIDHEFVGFFKKNNIPSSAHNNPLFILTDDAKTATWQQQRLPSDRVSTENGAILTSSERYSLIIDPQLQGILWLKERERSSDLQVTRLSNPKMVKIIEQSVELGKPVLLENLENSIDAVIAPVYGRAVIKKGKNRYIKLGDKELNLHDKFNLYMHTKLSNPHYPPEIQAECTLINFTVTENGLEDQLLSLVVKMERPDLAAQKEQIVADQNSFKITLKELEADLLYRLANAVGDILENISLIENLERSKALSTEINEKVEISKVTEVAINEASEVYRPAASRGALVFFLMNDLPRIHAFYKFSLDSFIIVIRRAITKVADAAKKAAAGDEEPAAEEGEEGAAAAAPAESEKEENEEEAEMTPRTLGLRVDALTESITYEAFNYVRRGTFERHKLIIATMLTFRINIRKQLIDPKEVDALIKKEVAMEPPNQSENLKFIPESAWAAVKGLESLKLFENIITSMEAEALQWRKWFSSERAEIEELPRAYKELNLFHRMLLLRAMRPDRLSGALNIYVEQSMGEKYVQQDSFDVFQLYAETNTITPVFFVLFPGVDPTPDVEKIGRAAGKSGDDGTFINISMGQGQEEGAIKILHDAGKTGKWAMFQNVHLMQDWMKDFERNLEIVIENGAHPEFRCFVSSEAPPVGGDQNIIPESILQNAIKIANEAPQDLKSNMRRCFSKFDEEQFEKAKSHKLSEYKALLFGLCMFHSLIVGRKKFGSQGWSRNYNFNDGDLSICGDVLHNYLAKYEKVPYKDLAYIYGEIMYGGHITDNWDRRTNNTYLEVLIRPEILQQMQLTLAPGFKSPDPLKFDREAYRKYIEEKLPVEEPKMFGLHPNAEIGYLTTQGEGLFATIAEVSGGGAGGSGDTTKVKALILQFVEQLPQEFNMFDIMGKTKDRNPYIVVCFQECERMNVLTKEIKTSLLDLDAGLKGQLNVTDAMEATSFSLNLNLVPDSWGPVAYFSKKSLIDWYADLLQRITQLQEWAEELITPIVVWISGLFNPMSYLTAIKQVTARSASLPLDEMELQTTVMNTKNVADYPEFAEAGAYINGFFLEGAAWENGRGAEQGYLTEMVLKELHPDLPIMHVTAVTRANFVTAGMYECPVYITTMRGPTCVFTAYMKMESEDSDPKKWILAGCALLMAPE